MPSSGGSEGPAHAGTPGLGGAAADVGPRPRGRREPSKAALRAVGKERPHWELGTAWLCPHALPAPCLSPASPQAAHCSPFAPAEMLVWLNNSLRQLCPRAIITRHQGHGAPPPGLAPLLGLGCPSTRLPARQATQSREPLLGRDGAWGRQEGTGHPGPSPHRRQEHPRPAWPPGSPQAASGLVQSVCARHVHRINELAEVKLHRADTKPFGAFWEITQRKCGNEFSCGSFLSSPPGTTRIFLAAPGTRPHGAGLRHCGAGGAEDEDTSEERPKAGMSLDSENPSVDNCPTPKY